MTTKILLLDKVHPSFEKMLDNKGFEVHTATVQSEAELASIISSFNVLVVRSSPKITPNIIDSAPGLKCIARAGSGIESIDYSYARSKGIHVVHSPEGNCDAVGEHALALSLCLLKHIVSSSMQVKRGIWNREENRGSELIGRTVGIIGYGNTGSAFARKLSGMGVKILAFDKYKTGFGNDMVEETDLLTLQRMSQIISFHVPLTEETHHYADVEFWKKCNNEIVLLNTSRGSVVHTAHLVDAMKCGKVVAAGLDVVEWETYDFDVSAASHDKNIKYLLDSRSVIITPHIAGITHEATLKHAQILVEKISSCLV